MNQIVKEISYENMSFFAKHFIQTNSSKTSDDLSLYGMITYMMLYINCFSNENMKSINDMFTPFFKQEKQNVFGSILFLSMVLVFYSTFHSSKKTFSNLVKKVIFTKKNTLNKSIGQFNQFNLFDKCINIISGFFSPCIFFFKIFL